jgi:hypothetical protein
MSWIVANPGLSAAIGTSILGTAVQMAGANAQAKGQARAARYNARVNERNAAARGIEADWRELVGDLDIQDYSDDFEELQAEVGARQRGNGWQMTGTAIDVMVRNAEEADEDIQRMKIQSYTEAMALREEGVNYRMAAELDRLNAQNYIQAGRWKALSALTTGVSRTAFMLV